MQDKDGLRAPLARVRGLGSAKHGSAHWWTMRLSSLALVFLCGWFIIKLVFCLSAGDYAAATEWLRQPLAAALMMLFLAVGFHHAANGLQTVIEDYVHCECARLTGIIAVKFIAAALAVTGIVAVGKIAFGS